MIKTYVINSPKAIDRRKHVEKELNNFPFLHAEFITAIMGKDLSLKEIEISFDVKSFKKQYHESPQMGAIGCTLSHRLCYHKLLESDSNFALILEDDATFNKNIETILPILYNDIKNKDIPTVLILSPSYTYTTKKRYKDYTLCHCFEATMAIGYLINRNAAHLILKATEYPHYLADDWYYLKKLTGIEINGLDPFLICWDNESFTSQINETRNKTTDKNKMLLKKLIHINLKRSVTHRFLKLIGHFRMGI